MFASDGKKYLSDVINENGVRFLLTIIPSKYKKQIQDWIIGLLDPIDEQSKKKAYDLYKTDLIEDDEIGKTISLKKYTLTYLKDYILLLIKLERRQYQKKGKNKRKQTEKSRDFSDVFSHGNSHPFRFKISYVILSYCH